MESFVGIGDRAASIVNLLKQYAHLTMPEMKGSHKCANQFIVAVYSSDFPPLTGLLPLT